MSPAKPKQQAQETRTGDGFAGDPAAKEQAQSSRPAPVAEDPGEAPAPDPTAPLAADPNAHPQVVDLNGCARCRTNGHPGLLFHPLTYPIPDGDGGVPWTHWAECPTNGQPILLRDEELADQPPAAAPVPDAGTA